MKRNMTIEELEAEAAHLSNFDGDDEIYSNYGGGDEYMDGYDGEGDEFVDFGGDTPAASFADAVENKRVYTLTLVNANAATRYAYLVPSYLNPAGAIATGAFNDRDGNAGLTGAGSPQSIENFLAYIDRNPTLILGMRIKSTLSAQLDEQMTIQEVSPFKSTESRQIVLSSYVDENNFNDKIATITESFFASNQMQVLLPVAGSSTATITLYCGPSLNTAKALETKTKRAKLNIYKAGGPDNVKRLKVLRGMGRKRLG